MATIKGGWYTDGTVSVTNGSAVVTGVGTAWTANAKPGDLFGISDGGVVTGLYQIAAVSDSVTLTLDTDFAGTTGATLDYAIIRNFGGIWSAAADSVLQMNALRREFERALENNFKGDQGPPGDDGSVIHWGTGAPPTNLGDDNDYYVDVASWNFYELEAGVWTLLGSFKGAIGDAGINGTSFLSGAGVPVTASGSDGDLYLDINTGDVYKKVSQTGWGKIGNFKGPQGIQGNSITGPAGPTGATGSEWQVSPSEPPSNVLGRDLDMCLITSGTARGRYYKKLSGAWVYQGTIRGSEGQAGATGPTGLTWLGVYDPTATYNPTEAVSYNGSSFIALTVNTGVTPAEGASWGTLARQGAAGAGSGDMQTSVYDTDGDGIVDYADEASHAASADSAATAALAQSVPDGVINHNTLASLHGGTPADEDVEAEMYHMTAAQNAAMVANARLSGSNAAASMLDVSESAQGLQTQINSIENRGLSVGSFDTFADLPANASSFAAIEVNDYATVRADETHGGGLSRYVVTAIGTDGAITWEFDYALSTEELGLRQLDLYLPGKFAAAATLAALAAAKDYAIWELEPAALRYIKVRCAAADSGATPCSVQLMVNAAAVGGTVQAVASSWTTLAITGVTLNTGDQIEIAVTNTGTNKDSADLRFVVVAEV